MRTRRATGTGVGVPVGGKGVGVSVEVGVSVKVEVRVGTSVRVGVAGGMAGRQAVRKNTARTITQNNRERIFFTTNPLIGQISYLTFV
jgi:hypothetical protein